MILVLNRNSVKRLVYFQLLFVLLINIFISMFNVPSSVMYLTDLINIILIFFVLYTKNLRKSIRDAQASHLIIELSILGVILLFGVIINLVNPMLVLWAIRNNYRFFVFFFSCIYILDCRDVEKIFDLMLRLQIINFILSLYQFFVLNKSQDYLGGIFGIDKGCNVYSNIFFCLLCTYAVSKYLHRKMSITKVIAILLSCLILAALAELKVFFIEFALIIILGVVFSKPNIKNFSIIFVSIVLAAVGLKVFKNVFLDAYEVIANISKLVEYSTTEIWGYKISRFGAFREINQIFFKNNVLLNLFGYGFGNCEYSSYSFFTSNFYNRYGYYNYRWFAHQMWFLESGYLGFGLFVLFFILLFVWGTKNKKKLGIFQEYGLFLQIFSIITIISIWYNQSIRVEVAYIIMFALASPLIIMREKVQMNKKLKVIE